MEAPWISWEGTAASAVEEARVGTPVSAYELARGLGLRVIAGAVPGARLNIQARVIELNTHARMVRRHGAVAHEVGHFLLRREDPYADSEAGANFVGGAMMLPRRAFDLDLRRTAWSLRKLRGLHPNVSGEMIARRIVELRGAVTTIIDGRRVRRVASPWLLHPRLRRLSRWERELAECALETGEEAHGDDLCYAVPLIDGPWRRVIMVCEIEQLRRRLCGGY